MGSAKTNYLLIALLVVAAFLAGVVWTKREKVGTGGTVPSVTGAPTQAPFSAPKSDKPQVKFFVMAFCPYGNQAESGLGPVYNLLKEKVDWQPRYVISQNYCSQAPDKAACEKSSCLKSGSDTYCSMHGLAELNEDIREICAFNLGDSQKWWNFIAGVNANCSAQNVETCWEKYSQEAGLDTAKIKNCQKSEAASLIKNETAEMEKYQAQGSPMVFVNDKLYGGGRSPEDYKKAICSAFNKEPSECSTVLSATTDAVAGGCQ
jgi:glutaredoxin